MHSHEAMALSDVDATYFELEQAALEHSIETHVQLEHGKKQRASSSEDYNDSQICSVGTPVSDSLLDASTPPLIVSQNAGGRN